MKKLFPVRLMVVVLLFGTGCGWLADKERIPVARIGDEVIRREDLTRVLRRMLPEDRPFIRTRSDLLRVLENHIDGEIKQRLLAATQLETEVPRELAAAYFDASHPEYRAAMNLEQAQELGLGQGEIEYYRSEREIRIDRIHEEMRGEAAVRQRIRKETESGELSVTDEEYMREYEYRKDQLRNYETVTFEGLVFPQAAPGAANLAANARNRILSGELVDDIAAEYAAAGTAIPMSSALERNPDPRMAPKFASFWQAATGASQGEVVGPVFISGWEIARRGPDGEAQSTVLPDSFLVCLITKAEPETPMTFEEAKRVLEPDILYAKMIRMLREENGVEVYEESLPDPAMYNPSGPRSIFDERPGAHSH